ncbi:tRNA-guanine(15) transglycosylase-like domain-containing protein [Entamoeba marina]
MTKVGSIPFVTIDNHEKYLKDINTMLFSFHDLYECQKFLLEYGKGYKQYFMLPNTTQHILTPSLLNRFEDSCNKCTKTQIAITTRGGYRDLTMNRLMEIATKGGFSKVEAFCYSPLPTKRAIKKMKVQRGFVIKALKELISEKDKQQSNIQIIGSLCLSGDNDDNRYIQEIINCGVKEVVFDVEYVEDKLKLFDYYQNVINSCSVPCTFKLYNFDLVNIINAALLNVNIWSDSVNDLIRHGHALVFPMNKVDNPIAIIDLFEDQYKEAVDVPLVEGCDCFTCKTHTRGYIHHLLKCHELTGHTLLSLHNYHHMTKFINVINTNLQTNRDFLIQLQDFYKTLPTPPAFKNSTLYSDN